MSFYYKRISKRVWGKSECLGKKAEQYKTFYASVERKLIKIDKAGIEIAVTISYKINSARSMATSLSNFVNNFTEGIHKIKCKVCDCFLEYESVKDNLIKY